MRIVALVVALSLASVSVAVPVAASPIREVAGVAASHARVATPVERISIASAGRRIAATMTAVQQLSDSCAGAATAGARDGRQRQGRAGWFFGGLFLPIIMPIVAHVSTPQPPADTVLQYSGDDARCYAASYSDAASSKRKQGAWIGSATAVGLFIALVASTASAY